MLEKLIVSARGTDVIETYETGIAVEIPATSYAIISSAYKYVVSAYSAWGQTYRDDAGQGLISSWIIPSNSIR